MNSIPRIDEMLLALTSEICKFEAGFIVNNEDKVGMIHGM